MMDSYSLVKLIHIISASLLFGTGIGTAFFMLRAHLSGSPEAMAVTTRNVVLADWIFTTPAIVVQATTGLWLTFKLAIPLGSVWFITVVSLFVLIGVCWIPVVLIQVRIRNIIANGGMASDYQKLMKTWVSLGVPAFISILILYFLMVTKTGAGTLVFV